MVLEQRAESLGAEFLAVVPHPDAYPKPWSMLITNLKVTLHACFTCISPLPLGLNCFRAESGREPPELERVSGSAGVQGMAEMPQGIKEQCACG